MSWGSFVRSFVRCSLSVCLLSKVRSFVRSLPCLSPKFVRAACFDQCFQRVRGSPQKAASQVVRLVCCFGCAFQVVGPSFARWCALLCEILRCSILATRQRCRRHSLVRLRLLVDMLGSFVHSFTENVVCSLFLSIRFGHLSFSSGKRNFYSQGLLP